MRWLSREERREVPALRELGVKSWIKTRVWYLALKSLNIKSRKVRDLLAPRTVMRANSVI